MAGARILIVEDDSAAALDWAQQLEDMGHEVVGHVTSGEEAVEKAVEIKPDLILMGIGLEGRMDGIDAVERIRSVSDVAVVYVTGLATVEPFERAILTDSDAYLTRPVSPMMLRTRVELALLKQEAEKRLIASESRYQTLVCSLEQRVKQLNGLYAISRLIETPGISFERIVQGVVDLILPAWHSPESTSARVVVDGREFRSGNSIDVVSTQGAAIAVRGREVGFIEVSHLDERRLEGEGPFLSEERSLLNAIAEHLGRAIESFRQREELVRAVTELQKANQETQAPLEISRVLLERRDFEKYAREMFDAGKQEVPGEGMGLAYVRTLVRRHGGHISCQSEPGAGSTFTFTVSKFLSQLSPGL